MNAIEKHFVQNVCERLRGHSNTISSNQYLDSVDWDQDQHQHSCYFIILTSCNELINSFGIWEYFIISHGVVKLQEATYVYTCTTLSTCANISGLTTLKSNKTMR